MEKNYVRDRLKVHLIEGLKELKYEKQKRAALVILEAVLAIVFIMLLVERQMAASVMEKISWNFNVEGYWMVVVVTNIVFLWIAGGGIKALKIEERLRCAGLKNNMGQSPVFIRCKHNKNDNFYCYDFLSTGIPLSMWNDRIPYIESAMNIVVNEVREGFDKEQVTMFAISGNSKIPEVVPWKNAYCNRDGHTLIAGVSIAGKITIDLKLYPHILIGGSTGSGKTVLLKNLLYQCLLNKFDIFVADFKGGVDYSSFWEKHCKFITKKDDLESCLDEILSRMEKRKSILRSADVRNIDEYNALKETEKMPRIVFACDEVAEILDKSGLSKRDKEEVISVESKISTIARLGRAFGIHLIVATQRPDANILSGQIKNNLDCRICGRADNVLSQIILDTTDAALKVPKYERGMFLNQSGELFRGYWMDEKKLTF